MPLTGNGLIKIIIVRLAIKLGDGCSTIFVKGYDTEKLAPGRKERSTLLFLTLVG